MLENLLQFSRIYFVHEKIIYFEDIKHWVKWRNKYITYAHKIPEHWWMKIKILSAVILVQTWTICSKICCYCENNIYKVLINDDQNYTIVTLLV